MTSLAFYIVLGLMVGSFLNVCIYRLPRDESIVFPRSRCPSCDHVLGPVELVPVASYLFQGGKCRHCRGRISPQYAIVELLTAAAFGLCHFMYFSRNAWADGAVFLYFHCALIVVIFIDLEHRLIFDVVTFPGMAIGFLTALIGHAPLTDPTPMGRVISSVSGLVVGAGALVSIQFLLWVCYFRWKGFGYEDLMGMGDWKLAAFTGSILGPRLEIAALLFAFYLGGAVALVLMIARDKGGEDAVPFGPFLAAGAMMAPFFGEWMMSHYDMFTVLREGY